MTAPHVPAAFINAIAEEGTKAEAIEYLQKQWNENCALRKEIEALKHDIDRHLKIISDYESGIAQSCPACMGAATT